MIDKDKSEQKIDPLAALINAHCRAMFDKPKEDYDPNTYADADFLKKLWGWLLENTKKIKRKAVESNFR